VGGREICFVEDATCSRDNSPCATGLSISNGGVALYCPFKITE